MSGVHEELDFLADEFRPAFPKVDSSAIECPAAGPRAFPHYVQLIIDKLNAGEIVQACAMIDVATKLLVFTGNDRAVRPLLARAQRKLQARKIAAYAENKKLRPLLLKVLHFFPGLGLQALLKSLYGCARREQRKLLLALLACHGLPTRSACLRYLEIPPGRHPEQPDLYFRRNLIFLLRRIPAGPEEDPAETAGILLRHIQADVDRLIVNEALAYLPQFPCERVEQALIQMLAELKTKMTREGTKCALEIHQAANRVCSALCQLGSLAGRTAVLDFALSRKPGVRAMAPLRALSRVNLVSDAETVDRLCTALEENLPLKILGVPIGQRDTAAACIAVSLSSTTHPRVLRLLGELAQSHPDTEAGRAAATILNRNSAQGDEEAPVAKQLHEHVPALACAD